ncbi:hypothetical protein D3C81_1854960 [compost metagenome]
MIQADRSKLEGERDKLGNMAVIESFIAFWQLVDCGRDKGYSVKSISDAVAGTDIGVERFFEGRVPDSR